MIRGSSLLSEKDALGGLTDLLDDLGRGESRGRQNVAFVVLTPQFANHLGDLFGVGSEVDPVGSQCHHPVDQAAEVATDGREENLLQDFAALANEVGLEDLLVTLRVGVFLGENDGARHLELLGGEVGHRGALARVRYEDPVEVLRDTRELRSRGRGREQHAIVFVRDGHGLQGLGRRHAADHGHGAVAVELLDELGALRRIAPRILHREGVLELGLTRHELLERELDAFLDGLPVDLGSTGQGQDGPDLD